MGSTSALKCQYGQAGEPGSAWMRWIYKQEGVQKPHVWGNPQRRGCTGWSKSYTVASTFFQSEKC